MKRTNKENWLREIGRDWSWLTPVDCVVKIVFGSDFRELSQPSTADFQFSTNLSVFKKPFQIAI